MTFFWRNHSDGNNVKAQKFKIFFFPFTKKNKTKKCFVLQNIRSFRHQRRAQCPVNTALHPDLRSHTQMLFTHFRKTAIDFHKHQSRRNTNTTQQWVFKVVHTVLNPQAAETEHHHAPWPRNHNCSTLKLMQFVKAGNPTNLLMISSSQQLHHDWAACAGMSWSMDINLNYWDCGRRGLGCGGSGAVDGRE